MEKKILPARSCPFTMQPVSGREKAEITTPPSLSLQRMGMHQKKEHPFPKLSYHMLLHCKCGNETERYGIISVAVFVVHGIHFCRLTPFQHNTPYVSQMPEILLFLCL